VTPLSIVVPVLDEAAALPAVLAALQPLRARGAEVIVVDGGSTDATWRLAHAGADRVLLAPRGRASQMNAGARVAGGAVLLFLHADTRLPPEADRRIAEAVAGGATWGRFDVRIDSPRLLLHLVAALMNLRSRLSGIATGDQALFVRRDTFEAIGGFADLPLMEDIVLSSALRHRGAPACLRERVTTSARRWERHGVLRTILLMWGLRLRWFFGADAQQLAERYGYPRRPPLARATVAVLAKAPVPGFAKTRLAAGVGDLAAARLHRGLTLDTLRSVAAAGLALRLHGAPDARHRFFRALADRCGIDVAPQPPGDLGARMASIVAAHFAAAPDTPLLLVGTDCPLLAPGHLQAAARALVVQDAVLVPAEDGGYVLLGLRRPLPAVFDAIAWSTAEVAEQTRERLRQAGVPWCELPPLWDLDEPADLRRLQDLLCTVTPHATKERACP
jgi:rSAM/selenodomain-associated transferase 2/rSAM/selenodomain-associated transferase 1